MNLYAGQWLRRVLCVAVTSVALLGAEMVCASEFGVTDGLMAYYSFDVSADDDGPAGHDGILRDGAFVGPAMGLTGVLDLRGGDGWVDIPTSIFSTETSCSLSAWVSVAAYTPFIGTVFTTRDADPEMGVADDASASVLLNTLATAFRTTGTIPDDESWHHIAFVYSAPYGQVNAYLNGEFDSAVFGTSGELCGDPGAGLIGGSNSLPGGDADFRFFNGRIDELRIYNRALTPAEIDQLYSFTQVYANSFESN